MTKRTEPENYIGKGISPHNTKEIVRALFTYFWVKWDYSLSNKKIFLTPEYSADPPDAPLVIELIHQVNPTTSLLELTQSYFSGPEIHRQAVSMTSKDSLSYSADHLFSLLADVDSEFAEPLLELLFLVDDKTGNLNFEILKNSGLYKVVKCQTVHENYRMLFHHVAECLRYTIDKSGLFVNIKSGFFVENRADSSVYENFKIVHCNNIAGACYLLGHVEDSASRRVRDEDCNTVFLMDEYISISSYILALPPAKHFRNDLLRKQLNILRKRLSCNSMDRAGIFRKWAEEYVLWHELGHLHTFDVLDQIKNELDGKYYFFDEADEAAELYADAFALTELEKNNDNTMSEFLIAYFLYCGALSKKQDQFYGKFYRLFSLRALFEEKPGEYLYSLLDKMKESAFKKDDKLYKKWINRQAETARQEVLMRLSR